MHHKNRNNKDRKPKKHCSQRPKLSQYSKSFMFHFFLSSIFTRRVFAPRPLRACAPTFSLYDRHSIACSLPIEAELV